MTGPEFFFYVIFHNSLDFLARPKTVKLAQPLQVMMRIFIIGRYVRTAIDVPITEGLKLLKLCICILHYVNPHLCKP